MICRKLLRSVILVLAVATCWVGQTAAQDSYPSKPITMIVTFAAGGTSDILARLAADRLEKELGVPINVVNVPGGAHIPGIMNFLNRPADGYTLLRWTTPSTIINPLIRDVPYEPLEQFEPLFMDATGVNVLYVRGDSPIRTLEQFVKAAKERTMTIGVNNIGAPPHLSAVQLSQEFGLEFKTLTMKTVPQSVTGLIGGQVDVAVGQLAQKLAFGDEIHALAVLDNHRQDYFDNYVPGTPTVGEVFPGKNAQTWINAGVAVKAGTPRHIVDRLVEASEKALNNDEYKKVMNERTTFRWISGAEAVGAEFRAGVALYKPLLDSLGLLRK